MLPRLLIDAAKAAQGRVIRMRLVSGSLVEVCGNGKENDGLGRACLASLQGLCLMQLGSLPLIKRGVGLPGYQHPVSLSLLTIAVSSAT